MKEQSIEKRESRKFPQMLFHCTWALEKSKKLNWKSCFSIRRNWKQTDVKVGFTVKSQWKSGQNKTKKETHSTIDQHTKFNSIFLSRVTWLPTNKPPNTNRRQYYLQFLFGNLLVVFFLSINWILMSDWGHCVHPRGYQRCRKCQEM